MGGYGKGAGPLRECGKGGGAGRDTNQGTAGIRAMCPFCAWIPTMFLQCSSILRVKRMTVHALIRESLEEWHEMFVTVISLLTKQFTAMNETNLSSVDE